MIDLGKGEIEDFRPLSELRHEAPHHGGELRVSLSDSEKKIKETLLEAASLVDVAQNCGPDCLSYAGD